MSVQRPVFLFITYNHLLFGSRQSRDGGEETPGLLSPGRGPPVALSPVQGGAGGARVAPCPPPRQPRGWGKAGCSFAALAAGAAAATSGAGANLECPQAAHPTASPRWDNAWDREVAGTLYGPYQIWGKATFPNRGWFLPPLRTSRVALCSGGRKYCRMVNSDQP